jgi:U3 small nucleolar RNA-associated protein 21
MQALFQPFRALGYISDDVPFAVQRRGKETFVTVSVGKAWQVRPLTCANYTAGLSAYRAIWPHLCTNSAGVLLLQARREACGTPGMRLGQLS